MKVDKANNIIIFVDLIKIDIVRKGICMKKRFLLLVTSLFMLTGCSSNKSNEINIDNPYEIAKGTSTLSYYDTEDSIEIDGFNVLENNLRNALDKNNNIIVNSSGVIRCITIVDDTVKTFRSISIGDKIAKIEETYNNKDQICNNYMVLFDDNNKEEDPANKNKEDTWIWITYYTDGSQITSIQIYDVQYGRECR